MNPEILAQADPHIQEEWEREREVRRVTERALQFATEAIADALAGKKVALPDKPSPEAKAKDWAGYFVKRAASVLD